MAEKPAFVHTDAAFMHYCHTCDPRDRQAEEQANAGIVFLLRLGMHGCRMISMRYFSEKSDSGL